MIIYLIAGPPGVGKSTNAKELIPKGVAIIDQNLAGYQYKKKGFADYKDLASLSSNQRVRDQLFGKQNFALELNLGFQSHYDYLRSIASFDPANKIHLLLFFTDNLTLCIDRAKIRHLSGGHEVKQAVIEEMYNNTISLLKQNLALFHNFRMVDITDTSIIEYYQTSDYLPNWILDNELKEYLTDSQKSQRNKKPRR